MRTKVRATKVQKGGVTYWRVITPKALIKDGEARERFFKRKDEATTHAEVVNAKIGTGASPLSVYSQMAQARIVRCIERVGGKIEHLEAVVDQHCRMSPTRGNQRTLREVIAEVIDLKSKGHRRQVYIDHLKKVLAMFARGREDKLIHEVTSGEIEEWLGASELAAWTRRGYISRLSTMFSHASRRRYIVDDPLKAVERPIIDTVEPAIISIDDARLLMRAAMESSKAMVTAFALQMFGYLRPYESFRINRESFLGSEFVVGVDDSKTRLRRVIPINQTLRAWLNLRYPLPRERDARAEFVAAKTHAGLLYLARAQRKPEAEVKKATSWIERSRAFPWHKDFLRHTCVSVSYVLYGARLTSEWSGHSEAMLYRHYRAIMSEEFAKQWMGLTPTALADRAT